MRFRGLSRHRLYLARLLQGKDQLRLGVFDHNPVAPVATVPSEQHEP